MRRWHAPSSPRRCSPSRPPGRSLSVWPSDSPLRRLCGWSRAEEVPSEATFSRAFTAFADSALPSRLHEALIDKTLRDHLVGHVSRDSTAIEGREKPTPKPSATPKRRRGRPRKGEQRPKASRRLERQLRMTLPEMLDDLPRAPDVSVKRGAKGYQASWSGYKLHIDAADGGIPLSCILTSASLHDSQAAIPLATMTVARVTNLYDLMDSAYDAPEIRAHSASMGHVAIIDVTPVALCAQAATDCGGKGPAAALATSPANAYATVNAQPWSASRVVSRTTLVVVRYVCVATPRFCAT